MSTLGLASLLAFLSSLLSYLLIYLLIQGLVAHFFISEVKHKEIFLIIIAFTYKFPYILRWVFLEGIFFRAQFDP